MGKIGLAFRAFFRVLLNRQVAEEVESLFRHEKLPQSDISAAPAGVPTPAKPVKSPTRSEALTLLATLQREARLLDLIQEPLEQFQDAQVGAAARDVLRNSREVLSRMFDIQPLLSQEEQSSIEIPAGFDAAEYRLTGNVHGSPPFQGTVQHRGWKAERCQVPEWSGSKEASLVVAPAEVELK